MYLCMPMLGLVEVSTRFELLRSLPIACLSPWSCSNTRASRCRVQHGLSCWTPQRQGPAAVQDPPASDSMRAQLAAPVPPAASAASSPLRGEAPEAATWLSLLGVDDVRPTHEPRHDQPHQQQDTSALQRQLQHLHQPHQQPAEALQQGLPPLQVMDRQHYHQQQQQPAEAAQRGLTPAQVVDRQRTLQGLQALHALLQARPAVW